MGAANISINSDALRVAKKLTQRENERLQMTDVKKVEMPCGTIKIVADDARNYSPVYVEHNESNVTILDDSFGEPDPYNMIVLSKDQFKRLAETNSPTLSAEDVKGVPVALEYFKPPFKYEPCGQTIYCDSPAGQSMALQVRGWGNLTGGAACKLPVEKAEHIQDEFGQWVADTLNNALSILGKVGAV